MGPKGPRTSRPKTSRTVAGDDSDATATASAVADPSEAGESETSFDPISERDEVALLAYAYWEARGGEGGSAEEDWIRAEEELRRRRAALR